MIARYVWVSVLVAAGCKKAGQSERLTATAPLPVRPSVVCPHPAKRVAAPDRLGDLDLPSQVRGAGPIGLVDAEDIRELHHPRLESLDPVSRLRHQYQDGAVGHGRHRELGLAHSHGFDQHAIEPERVEHVADLAGAGGEAPE